MRSATTNPTLSAFPLTIWLRTYDLVPRRGQVVLEGFVLPSYITSVGFLVTWSGWGVIFSRFNVFVVLDAPKRPMDMYSPRLMSKVTPRRASTSTLPIW